MATCATTKAIHSIGGSSSAAAWRHGRMPSPKEYVQRRQPSSTRKVGILLVRILHLLVLLGGTLTLTLGVLVTACSVWPLTDMADAAVFFRVGPRWVVGGVVTLVLARWLGKTAKRLTSPDGES
jgi:hypothetical protein